MDEKNDPIAHLCVVTRRAVTGNCCVNWHKTSIRYRQAALNEISSSSSAFGPYAERGCQIASLRDPKPCKSADAEDPFLK
jgi:hypothetical protein